MVAYLSPSQPGEIRSQAEIFLAGQRYPRQKNANRDVVQPYDRGFPRQMFPNPGVRRFWACERRNGLEYPTMETVAGKSNSLVSFANLIEDLQFN
jgi:hypothetical protein